MTFGTCVAEMTIRIGERGASLLSMSAWVGKHSKACATGYGPGIARAENCRRSRPPPLRPCYSRRRTLTTFPRIVASSPGIGS